MRICLSILGRELVDFYIGTDAATEESPAEERTPTAAGAQSADLTIAPFLMGFHPSDEPIEFEEVTRGTRTRTQPRGRPRSAARP